MIKLVIKEMSKNVQMLTKHKILGFDKFEVFSISFKKSKKLEKGLRGR